VATPRGFPHRDELPGDRAARRLLPCRHRPPGCRIGCRSPRKLVTASGHSADQIAIHPKGGTQSRNLPLKIIPRRCDRAIRAPSTHSWPSASSSRRCGNRRKRANAMPAGASEAVSMGRHYRDLPGNHRFFWDGPPVKPAQGAHRISQVFTARSKGVHRPCSLTLGALGEAEPRREHPKTALQSGLGQSDREKPL
jgi:hypothetical protein